jgi:hypothetical protein
MGDVVSSSKYEAKALQDIFQKLVKEANVEYSTSILSPLTVTLGDEFQSVIKSVWQGVDLIFKLEERCLFKQIPFKLHYVLYEGEIDTEINTNTAYGMLGSGLTKARAMLTTKKRNRKRFTFHFDDAQLTQQIVRLFEILDAIILRWNPNDYALIYDLIQNENNKLVGDKYSKTPSQIWKRRKNLMVHEYNLLKVLVQDLIKAPL